MAAHNGTQRQPRVPGYVIYWVGKRVQLPLTDHARTGVVTSVQRRRHPDGPCVYAHVAIDDGPLWIGPASELLILADRDASHGELDEIGS